MEDLYRALKRLVKCKDLTEDDALEIRALAIEKVNQQRLTQFSGTRRMITPIERVRPMIPQKHEVVKLKAVSLNIDQTRPVLPREETKKPPPFNHQSGPERPRAIPLTSNLTPSPSGSASEGHQIAKVRAVSLIVDQRKLSFAHRICSLYDIQNAQDSACELADAMIYLSNSQYTDQTKVDTPERDTAPSPTASRLGNPHVEAIASEVNATQSALHHADGEPPAPPQGDTTPESSEAIRLRGGDLLAMVHEKGQASTCSPESPPPSRTNHDDQPAAGSLPQPRPIPNNAEAVFCPWLYSFGKRAHNVNGCPHSGNHKPFVHAFIQGMTREPLECPFWCGPHGCMKNATECKFAHHHTKHGQRHYKPSKK